jgi:hypothetical protein
MQVPDRGWCVEDPEANKLASGYDSAKTRSFLQQSLIRLCRESVKALSRANARDRRQFH